MKLTARMRDTLHAATQQELRRTHTGPGHAAWPAPPATLAALVHRGLLNRTERRNRKGHKVTVWAITDAGRAALQPPDVVIVEKPRYLARGAVKYRKLSNGRWAIDDKDSSSDYTLDPRKSVDRDDTAAVEALPEHVLDLYAAQARQREQHREQHRADELARVPLEARIRSLAELASRHSATISGELRLIRHMTSNGRTDAALRQIRRLEASFERRAA